MRRYESKSRTEESWVSVSRVLSDRYNHLAAAADTLHVLLRIFTYQV